MSARDAVHPLHGFFEPASVAIIGASADPAKLGGRPIRFFRDAGYTGAIYPVNSRSTEIQGFAAYPSVVAIPGPVEHALLILPAKACLAALDDCAAKGVRYVQVLSSGFGEAGPEGVAMQQALLRVARAKGIRLIGPNCLGIVSVRNRFHATFSTALEALEPKAGGIAVATQSGAFGSCAYSMAIQRGLGLSRIVATGNEVDVDVAECIDYLAQDPDTRVICAAIEGCVDGNRLRAALRKAAAHAKPVVMMKVGTTAIGIAAAATHTGTLAGDDAVYDTVFAECGAWRADSIEEMLDIAAFCLTQPAPANADAGILTVSGGIGILMADAAEQVGFSLPPLPQDAAARCAELLPFAPLANPLDTTAQVSVVKDGVAKILGILLEQTDWATLLVYIAQMACAPEKFESTRIALVDLRRRFPDRCIVLVGPSDAGVRDRLEADGLCVTTDPSRAMRAAGAVSTMQARRRALAEDVDLAPDVCPAPGIDAAAPPRLHAALNEIDAKRLLSHHGIPVLAEHHCRSADEAVAAARATGFPVVLKILSPDIAHKTEIGGVVLGLSDEASVAAAFDDMIRRAGRAAPTARIDGALLAPMAASGVETILGVHVDPVFGPMIMFGMGGVAVELYKDVAFASVPLSASRADALVRRVRGSRLLDGWRGSRAPDRAALRDALLALSRFAHAHADTIAGVDLNPLLVTERGVVCLDAQIEVRDPETTPHRA